MGMLHYTQSGVEREHMRMRKSLASCGVSKYVLRPWTRSDAVDNNEGE